MNKWWKTKAMPHTHLHWLHYDTVEPEGEHISWYLCAYAVRQTVNRFEWPKCVLCIHKSATIESAINNKQSIAFEAFKPLCV